MRAICDQFGWGWGRDGGAGRKESKKKQRDLGQRFILETQNKEKAQKAQWQKGCFRCFPALVVEASVPMTKFKMLSKAWGRMLSHLSARAVIMWSKRGKYARLLLSSHTYLLSVTVHFQHSHLM